MNILIINAGSSSLKFQLIQLPAETVVCSGIVERIGSDNAVLEYKSDTTEIQESPQVNTHREGLQKIADLLLDPEKGAIRDSREINAVGHRVVHGGNTFAGTTLITEKVKEAIRKFATLAPLHNPHNLEGINMAEQLFPEAIQVAVFDTAFHQTMPVEARKYAIPNEFYTEHGIQAYGFHGISHQYVSEKAIAYLKKETSRIITVHLGNGCSMTAVINGKSMDHSLGFTPANGLIMGSRSGDIDHSIIFYLIQTLGYDQEEVNNILTKKSGMLGLTGHIDLRDIQAKAEKGDSDCQMALQMNAYRIKKYIGAYTAAMNGLDALIFTAGIGENSSMMRELVCTNMEYLGILLDKERNESKSTALRQISTDMSGVKILVVPTNEELAIAKQVFELYPA